MSVMGVAAVVAAAWLVIVGLYLMVVIGGSRVPVIGRRHIDHYPDTHRKDRVA